MKLLSKKMIADKISSQRKAKRLTQEQLGQKTGINRQIIGRIEKSEVLPSIIQLQNLAEALEFDVAELFEESTPNVRTAFRRDSENWVRENAIDKLLEMMMASKQQIVLRKAMKNE